MTKVFFQIGTHTGNDLFRKLVQKSRPELVILVEPNINLINSIKHNYDGIENVHIYNNAIYYNNDENLELYIPAKNGIMGNVGENNHRYNELNFSLLPMNDWGSKDNMVKITTKSITFDDICKNHNITNIEYLQIDTEGFDTEIIKMIDLKKYKINKIRFEKWEFPVESFTRYNENLSNELGINGFNNAINKLKQHNYNITDINDEDGSDVIATLI